MTTGGVRVPCAGTIIRDDAGRIVVIRRGHAPSAGLWSLPGGRVEAGENFEAAAAREALEETGLDVVIVEPAGEIELPGPSADIVYIVTDYFAKVAAGTSALLLAGDDASEAAWVSRSELAALHTTPGLLDVLDDWGVWDVSPGRSNDG